MRNTIFFALALLISTLSVSAQVSINGSLRGRIVDRAGANVAGASITLVNINTKQTQTTTASDVGEYNFARVASGTYSMTIEANGFEKTVRENIVVTVSENVSLDVTLGVEGIAATVDVQSDQQIVQSESSSVSALVSERRVAELPLNGKDFRN